MLNNQQLNIICLALIIVIIIHLINIECNQKKIYKELFQNDEDEEEEKPHKIKVIGNNQSEYFLDGVIDIGRFKTLVN